MIRDKRKIIYVKKRRCSWCGTPITKDMNIIQKYASDFCSLKCLYERQANKKVKADTIPITGPPSPRPSDGS